MDGVPYAVLNDGEIECEIDRVSIMILVQNMMLYALLQHIVHFTSMDIRQCVITLKFSYVLVLVSNTRAWSQNAAKAPSLFMW